MLHQYWVVMHSRDCTHYIHTLWSIPWGRQEASIISHSHKIRTRYLSFICSVIVILGRFCEMKKLNHHQGQSINFLDAIASPSSYPCQWVSESVSDSFRFPILISLLLLVSWRLSAVYLEGVWRVSGVSEGCLDGVWGFLRVFWRVYVCMDGFY